MTACVPWIKERPLLTVVTIALGIPFIDSPLRASKEPVGERRHDSSTDDDQDESYPVHSALPNEAILYLERAGDYWLRKEIRMGSTISTKDLKAKLDRKEDITMVETLAPERYREAHIPGALNIPPERIKELAPQLLPNKNAEIVTYCTNTH
jgi:hypothetical protein